MLIHFFELITFVLIMLHNKLKIGIVGLGWLGLPLAKDLFETGFEITGTVTSEKKKATLAPLKIPISVIEFSANKVRGEWETFIALLDVLVITLPPSGKGTIITEYPTKIGLLLKEISPQLKLVFISSTSVYGDTELDQIVTEESDLNPMTESAKALISAEQLITSSFNNNATIVRFAGLYGPNRHPGRFLSTNKIYANPNARINLIHQYDCIQLIKAIIIKNAFGTIYNGCSNFHPTREVFYTKAAQYLLIPPPKFDTTKKSRGKIVSNEKAYNLLGPDYSYHNIWDIVGDATV